MYEKSNIVPLASNASFIHKNLTILKAGSTSYAAVSKNAVNLTVANRSGTELDQKQIMPKIAKDELSALADGTENMLLAILTQCQFVEVAQRIVLVICATKGIFVRSTYLVRHLTYPKKGFGFGLGFLLG